MKLQHVKTFVNPLYIFVAAPEGFEAFVPRISQLAGKSGPNLVFFKGRAGTP